MAKRRNGRSKDSFQKIKTVEAKTDNQKNYIKSIIENEVIFCSGPSGCGKSFVAAGISA